MKTIDKRKPEWVDGLIARTFLLMLVTLMLWCNDGFGRATDTIPPQKDTIIMGVIFDTVPAIVYYGAENNFVKYSIGYVIRAFEAARNKNSPIWNRQGFISATGYLDEKKKPIKNALRWELLN